MNKDTTINNEPNEKDILRMKELIPLLNNAAKAYYHDDEEIMSNYEYDALYDELVLLEERTGTVLALSPTASVGYEAADFLPKERHESPMLSLAKTKDRDELVAWTMGQEALLSWKLDGLTVVVTYENGELVKAITRGNGEIGEVITANARCFANLPLKIAYRGKLVLRGEAVISYADFEKINDDIVNPEEKYKNPRNLCSGSVRALDPLVTKSRCVNFIAFSLVTAIDEDGKAHDFANSRKEQFNFLVANGFEVVEYKAVDSASVKDAVSYFEKNIATNKYPSDGLVLLLNDIAYGEQLGRTAKFPRNAIAFKWADETAQTVLRQIEWSPSRTGLINPVAIFDPVELEGTTVSRASVHNVSMVKALSLGVGDLITVYKANMIIPQIAENLTKSGNVKIPDTCPACMGQSIIKSENETQTLFCTNPLCPAKQIKSFALVASRDALNIEGLSEQTLEKFVGKGFIQEPADIFKLDRYKDVIVSMDGFGEKSYSKLSESIEKSRHTTMQRFLYSLGIPGFGVSGAKLVAKFYDSNFESIIGATCEELSGIDGIGAVMASDFVNHFGVEKNLTAAQNLFKELDIYREQIDESSSIAGKIFVITGSVNHFANRNELKAFIESKGGKATGSVTSNTDYLINNDVNSTSSKNKKARELGVEIISEDDFLKLVE